MAPDFVILSKVALVLALVLSPIAALMSYLITYQEYAHHFPDKRNVHWISLKTALATWLFFVVLTLSIFYILSFTLASKGI